MTDEAAPEPAELPRTKPALRVVSWIFGAAAVAAVIVFALHFSEDRAFFALVEQAQPEWLIVAVVLQLLTYVTQAYVWRIIARRGGGDLSFRSAFRLSFAKLFVDQALPSGGLSGTVILVRALELGGMPRPLVYACVVVDGAAYYAAYVVALAAAVAIAGANGALPFTVFVLSAVFVVLAMAACALLLAFAGRPAPSLPRLRRIRAIDALVRVLASVDGALARNPVLLLQTTAVHAATVLLDSATVWILLFALGVVARPEVVFVSFMTSTLLRTVGVLPGGLGTFEATSVVTLRLGGIPLAAALSATIAFRALSFWLPMIPGLFFSRRAAVRRPPRPPDAVDVPRRRRRLRA